MVFSRIAVTVDMNMAILDTQHLSFGRLDAFILDFGTLGTILAAWGHIGGPWEQQEGHVGVWNQF